MFSDITIKKILTFSNKIVEHTNKNSQNILLWTKCLCPPKIHILKP